MFCDTKINEIAGDIFSDHRELEKIELRQGIIKCNNLDLSSLDKLKEIKIWNLIQLDFVKPALEKINFDDTRKVKLIFKRPLKEEKVVILASKEDVQKLSYESFHNYIFISVDVSLPMIEANIEKLFLTENVKHISNNTFWQAFRLQKIFVQNIDQANQIISSYSSPHAPDTIVLIYFPNGNRTVVIGEFANIKLKSEDDCVDLSSDGILYTKNKVVKGIHRKIRDEHLRINEHLCINEGIILI